MKRLFIISGLTFLSISVIAQTQTEMNEQAHKDFLKTEKELNSTYNKILKQYKSDTAFIKNFKKAQQIWLKLRDAEMEAKFPDRDKRNYGSIFPMCWSSYLAELTQERIKKLEEWLTGTEEGGCAGSVKIKDE